jgi:hypothetical protein
MMLGRLELALAAFIIVTVTIMLTRVSTLQGALPGNTFYVRQASSRRAAADTVVYQKQANGIKY